MIGEIRTNLKLYNTILEKLKEGKSIKIIELRDAIVKNLDRYRTNLPLFKNTDYVPSTGTIDIGKFNLQLYNIFEDLKFLGILEEKIVNIYSLNLRYYTRKLTNILKSINQLKQFSEYVTLRKVNVFIEDFSTLNNIDTSLTTAYIDVNNHRAISKSVGEKTKVNLAYVGASLLNLSLLNTTGSIEKVANCDFENAIDNFDMTSWSFIVKANTSNIKLYSKIKFKKQITFNSLEIMNASATSIKITYNDVIRIIAPSAIGKFMFNSVTTEDIDFYMEKPADYYSDGFYYFIFSIADLALYTDQSTDSMIVSTPIDFADSFPYYILLDSVDSGKVDYSLIIDNKEINITPGIPYVNENIEQINIEYMTPAEFISEYNNNKFYEVAHIDSNLVNSKIKLYAFRNALKHLESLESTSVNIPLTYEATTHVTNISLNIPSGYRFNKIIGIYAYSQLLDKNQYTYLESNGVITITFSTEIIGTINVLTECTTTTKIFDIYTVNALLPTEKSVDITVTKPSNINTLKILITSNDGNTNEYNITNSDTITIYNKDTFKIIASDEIVFNDVFSYNKNDIIFYSGSILTEYDYDSYIASFKRLGPIYTYGLDENNKIILGESLLNNLVTFDGNDISFLDIINNPVNYLYIKAYKSTIRNARYKAIMKSGAIIENINIVTYGDK